MVQVTVQINGRNYEIACDKGQEQHLKLLAEHVNERVDGLVANLGQVGDTRLLVMASLLLADELAEVYAEVDEIRNRNAANNEDKINSDDFETIADRIEKVAEKLEGY